MITSPGRQPIRAFVLSAILFAAFAGAGVAKAQNNNAPRRSPNASENLAREVRHQLVLLPFYSVFDILQFSVNGDDVTLSGAVHVDTLKSDAVKAVKGIEGVGNVTDNIELLPASQMDDQIRRAEYRSIYGFPSLERYSYGSIAQIHIIVKNGHVTLEGQVDNQADKDTAGIRAKTVPNAFSVDNNLKIGPTS